MLEIVHRHAPDFDGATMEMKTSKHGKYLSITCTINATSREQLDALYQRTMRPPDGGDGALRAGLSDEA